MCSPPRPLPWNKQTRHFKKKCCMLITNQVCALSSFYSGEPQNINRNKITIAWWSRHNGIFTSEADKRTDMYWKLSMTNTLSHCTTTFVNFFLFFSLSKTNWLEVKDCVCVKVWQCSKSAVVFCAIINNGDCLAAGYKLNFWIFSFFPKKPLHKKADWCCSVFRPMTLLAD